MDDWEKRLLALSAIIPDIDVVGIKQHVYNLAKTTSKPIEFWGNLIVNEYARNKE